MTIGAVVLARLSSTRLPAKAFRDIEGKELLLHIVDNLSACRKLDKVIVATSIQPEDDEIERFCNRNEILCFRGSLNNVAERFLNASRFYDLTHTVRINGDNLFANPELVDNICQKAQEGFDFVSNVPGRTFPVGMSVELIETQLYEHMYSKFSEDSHFEHVTSYLYQNDSSLKKCYIKNPVAKEAAGVPLAVDTKYDLQVVRAIFDAGFKASYSIDLKSLAQRYKKLRSNMSFTGKYGPLLIAEIGGNHEGDFDYAKKLTELAIESDADIIKFQIYSGNTLVNPVESPDRHKHFKKFELSRQQYVELAKLVTFSGKKFMASIWDADMIDWVDEYNPIYKVGSGDLLAWPLLAELASREKPIILSTGLATEEEVLATVDFLRKCNSLYVDSNYLAVLQCTSMYPIPKSAANLNVMLRLGDLTKASIGYSDHTEGSDALKVAVSMGAKVLEFHFTDDRENKTFRDHKVSLTKDEVHDLIEYSKMVDLLQGNDIKQPVPVEIDSGHVESFRRAVYLVKDLPEGHTVSSEDLTILRPSHGLSSRYVNNIIGLKTTRSIRALEKLSLEDFT